MKPVWLRAAEYAGFAPGPDQVDLMERYAGWLSSEGEIAGGIGPGETDRLDRRHLADSVLFASQLPTDVGTVWDLGSGVGLPGIPLAICLPHTEFVLIDRSGRRTDLLRRAVRMLALENCQVKQGEIAELTGRADAVVSRASLPPDELRRVVGRVLKRSGVAVVAGSWWKRPEHPGWTTIEIPPDVLDQTVWLLIMRRE